MNRQLWIQIGSILLVLLIIVYAFTFILYEGRLAVVTRFGAPRTNIQKAGLYWKLPYPFERVYYFDGRSSYFDTSYVEVLTKDKRNVILQTFVVWSIDNPLLFFQSVSNRKTAESILNNLVNNAKNTILGNYNLSNLVSTEPETLKILEIEDKIYQEIKDTADNRYGVNIEQIGIKRLGLPKSNIRQVFRQMRAERERDAARYRAEGIKEANKIRNETDVEVAKILAEGEKKAAKISGQTEKEMAEIYATAYQKNPDLFNFLLELDSLEKIVGKQTTLIIDGNNSPFSHIFQEVDQK